MRAPDYQTPQRMALKQAAVPLPDLAGRKVLDIGCDAGWWSFLANDAGAVQVVGLDRGREVRGFGFVDVVAENNARVAAESRNGIRFEAINLGKEWRQFGRFDVVLVLSVYHHLYEAAGGDHRPVWFWLWQHCRAAGQVLWEGPLDDRDPVVRANVSTEHRAGYNAEAILAAASWFFAAERIGPALHEPTREVWRFRPHPCIWQRHYGTLRAGMGGATKAFEHAGGRRATEIERILGWRPYPGSLNVMLDAPFGWDDGYYRAEILDVVNRAQGFASAWAPRWARFYPVRINGEDACALRFEGEVYDPCFMELIAPYRLRDIVAGPQVLVTR